MNTQRPSGERPDRTFAVGVRHAGKVGRRAALALCLAATVSLCLSACSSSTGGSNGHPNHQKEVNDASTIEFSFPYNGEQDVPLNSQIVLKAQKALNDGSASSALALEAVNNGSTSNVASTVTEDSNQPGIYRIQTAQPLLGNTTYRVVAASNLQAGVPSVPAGSTIFQFTTGPTPGRPTPGDFHVVQTAPGETNPVTGQTTVFAQFDTVHVSLSEAVDPSTVIKGQSFRFTNSSGGEVPGVLTTSGNEITFAPRGYLAPGAYTVSLSDNVKSEFGKSLTAYSVQRTVLNSGDITTHNLTIDNSQGFAGDADNSILNGQQDNLVTLKDQLIGTNQQPARSSSTREALVAHLSQPGMPGFGNQFPNSIPAGQTFELKPLDLKLNGDLQTPIQSGPIQVSFASPANITLEANNYRDIASPTAVHLRFDLNNTTLISAAPGTPSYIIQALSNGLINQSALNIQASGLAIPQKNGDLLISTIGTFPLTVNRTDGLTVDFALTLRLPAQNETQTQPDTVAPFITAQVPSACFYVSGTPAYQPTFLQSGASPIVLPEKQCVGVLQGGQATQTPSGIDSAALDGDIAVTFSEPLDPLTVNSQNIQLTGGGTNVPATFATDGSTVTIHPDQQLQPDTQYTVTLNGSGLTDFAGNAVQSVDNNGPGQTITFTTEPMSGSNPTPPILGQLSPGLACAVTGGNFASGGNVTGHCAGDSAQSGNSQNYPVEMSPINVPINGYFSKPVDKSSVVLANGCLTGGSGQMNTNASATVALERVNGSGQCVGAAPASLVFADSSSQTTNGFSIRPVGELDNNQRYWVVVCGTSRTTPATSCSAQIKGINGFALNTDPLNGTGSTQQSTETSVAGGPDIIVPFQTDGFTTNYYADQFTLPATDTNGNGQTDPVEHPQPPNTTNVSLALAGVTLTNPNTSNGDYPSYAALNRPIVIGQTSNNCSAVQAVTDNSGSSVIGTATQQCIPVSLLPGGINDLTAIKVSAQTVLDVLPQVVTNLLGNLVDQGILGVNTPLAPALNALGKSLDNVLAPILAGATASGSTGSSSAGGPGNAGSPGSSAASNGGGLLGQVGEGVGSLLGGVNTATGTNANTGNGAASGTVTTVGDLVSGSLGNVDNILGNAAAGNGTVSSALQPLQQIVQALQQVLKGLVNPDGNIANTGRILLRYPDQQSGNSASPQTGYIVPECKGSLNGNSYDYAPCFVAHLTLTTNAPDATGLSLMQQPIMANVFGPLTFEQNGRLVIPLKNANQIQLNATAAGLFPTTATIQPGSLHLQLAGNAAHGGVAFPQR